MNHKTAFLLWLCLLPVISGWSQKGVTTFGLQYKPIIPSRFIGTYQQDFNQDQLVSSLRQKVGHSFGGVIRHGINNTISLETGIGFTQRNFALDFAVPDSGYSASGDVGVISYEIPLSCLVYIRLGEDLYMNTALGSALTLFPSSVQTEELITAGEYFLAEGAYKHKAQGALIANIGFEYRTRSKGYFYLGSSYHLPFAPIMTFALAYEYPGGDVVSRQNVRGSYLTVDFRYFFHEKPEEKPSK